jgi:uncharacterized membrane protein YphA (DoxX/SURF4 family)
MMKTLRIASRIIVGALFIFSGFVKDIDPMGSAYKFMDYFVAFHLGFLNFAAFPLAILLSTGELVIGINLVLGIRMHITSYALMIFMSFFTVLTFILAIFNPVSDCGCFGDAVILTNWQTFWKDIILLAPTLVIFFSRNKYVPFYADNLEWRLTAIFILIGVLISVYSYRNLPPLDFRPYKIGTNIPEKMTIPEDAELDEYKITVIYEKNGIRKEFEEKNIPWQDTTWKWVETKQVLIKKGYEPPIHDFTITTLDDDDITDLVISDPGYSFLLIADDLTKSDINAFRIIDATAQSCISKNCSFYCLTSSTTKEIENFREKLKPSFDFYTMDEITLKTIIRSNPGLLLIKEGNIIGKWHYNNFPAFSDSDNNYIARVLDSHRKTREKLSVYFLAACFITVVCVYHIVILKTK